MTVKEDLDARALTISYAQAMAYVWGYQDAKGESDSDQSIQFATAYRSRREAYLTERTWFMPTMSDAFKEWLATGEIALTH